MLSKNIVEVSKNRQKSFEVRSAKRLRGPGVGDCS